MPAAAKTKIRRLRREQLPQHTVKLARFLIGKVVVHDLACGRLSGRIVEAEAYPPGDPAGHHFRGPTPRIRSMYLAPGHAYVFFNYGAHFMLNVSSEPEGIAGGILIRALEPLDGVEWMRQHRGGSVRRITKKVTKEVTQKVTQKIAHTDTRKSAGLVARKKDFQLTDLTRGPGRVAAALQVDRRLDGMDLCAKGSALWLGELVEEGRAINSIAGAARRKVARTVRIGISRAADKLLRFYERGNPFVSGPKRLLLPMKKKTAVGTVGSKAAFPMKTRKELKR
jgi:DNA-3-methyladenine glycosylase